MGIFEQEEALFEEWRNSIGEGFIPDGVACEEAYLQSSPKILLVLKEVDDFEGDLRELLRRGGVERTWNMATRWIQGIRALPEAAPWGRTPSEVDRKEALRTIAAVNLKKTTGKSTSYNPEIERAAIRVRNTSAGRSASMMLISSSVVGGEIQQSVAYSIVL